MTLILVRGENNSVNVKRLPKKPAPARFGRKLTDGQRALATHVCVDCGYVYADATPFKEVPESYRCPQCQAPKVCTHTHTHTHTRTHARAHTHTHTEQATRCSGYSGRIWCVCDSRL